MINMSYKQVLKYSSFESNQQKFNTSIKLYRLDEFIQANLNEYSRNLFSLSLEVLDIDSKTPLDAEVVIKWDENIFDDIWMESAIQHQKDQFVNIGMYNQYKKELKPERYPLNYYCGASGKARIPFPELKQFPLKIPVLVRKAGYKAYEGELIIEDNISKSYQLLLPTLGSKMRIEMSKPVTPKIINK